MATLTTIPNAQWALTAVFSFNAADSMVNTDGVSKTFGDATPGKFDIFTMPPNSMVIDGCVKVETVAAGNTSAVDVGDSDDEDRYTETSPVDLADADAPYTGFDMLGDHKVYSGSQKIRISITNGGAVTATKAHIVVTFVIIGRANENLKTT